MRLLLLKVLQQLVQVEEVVEQDPEVEVQDQESEEVTAQALIPMLPELLLPNLVQLQQKLQVKPVLISDLKELLLLVREAI
jgi:hypothetical protein